MSKQTLIDALTGRIVSLSGKIDRIKASADKEERDFSEQEHTILDSLIQEIEDLEGELAELENRERPKRGPKSGPGPIRPQNRPHIQPEPELFQRQDDGGFRNFGDFCLALNNAVRGQPDQRLMQTPRAEFEEGTGSDGGFLVPGRYADAILQDALVTSGVLDRTTKLAMPNGNLTVASMDAEDHTGGAIAGLTLEWRGESEQLTSQTPTLKTLNFRARKGTIMVAASNELLYDAPSADRQLRDIFSSALRYGLEAAVLDGSGTGRPLGVLNSGCLITVDKESGQAADTLVYENLVAMLSRLHPGMVSSGVWVVNPSTLPQLLALKFLISNAASSDYVGGAQVPVQTDQAGTYRLLGLPLVFSEALPVLGDAGDIVLANFGEYVIGMTLDMSVDVSPHLKFDYDQSVYRLRIRLDGMPRWSGAITPVNGSTLSPFVTLQART